MHSSDAIAFAYIHVIYCTNHRLICLSLQERDIAMLAVPASILLLLSIPSNISKMCINFFTSQLTLWAFWNDKLNFTVI